MRILSAIRLELESPFLTVDTSSMIENPHDEFDAHPEWRLVLEAYAAVQQATPKPEKGDDIWLSRTAEVEGVEDEHLPRIHGKLIALELLQFQLADRNAGVLYNVTKLGQQYLERTPQTVANDGPPEPHNELAQSA